MEPWQRVFRSGLAPNLSTAALAALADGLERNDPALVQGMTCLPPFLPSTTSLPPESACPLVYAGWMGDGLSTVGDLEKYFMRVCWDGIVGRNAAGLSAFLAFVDDSPRDVMRLALAEECRRELAERGTK